MSYNFYCEHCLEGYCNIESIDDKVCSCKCHKFEIITVSTKINQNPERVKKIKKFILF